MPRSFGALIQFGANGISAIASAGTITYTRNAADNDVSWNMAASSTATLNVSLDPLRRPYFVFPQPIGTNPTSNEFQEVFGTAAGGPGNPWNGGQTPTTGSQFGVAFNPWGLAVIDVFAIYSVTTNPLTSATISLFRNTFTENVAFGSTTLVNAVTLSTTVTAAANAPHVQKASLVQPLVYEATDFSDLLVSLDIAVPAGGSARIYGMGFHVAAEYS